MYKISFITTVFNEEKTIKKFLDSLTIQTQLPNEIIIVDGASTDKTYALLNKYKFPSKIKKITILRKKGNRSVGRNAAIKHARGEIIICSDSGNILDKNWIKNITNPFINKEVDVVSGYYQGKAVNTFQKCLIPYVLVMPDKVDPNNFLPATRSIAFTKKIWERVGGFDEQYSHNEDYVFAKKLKAVHAKIIFAKDAVAIWLPRNTYKEAFIMFFRFAYGDAEAKLYRPKVLFLFVRYLLGILFLLLAIIMKSSLLFIFCLGGILFYLVWAGTKNYKYVKKWQALFILPLIQLVADWAVMIGTVMGVLKIWDIRKIQ